LAGAAQDGRQRILNSTVPASRTIDSTRRFRSRVVWEQDGEEQLETVALGWTGQDVYVRNPDRRYRLTLVWLNAADVIRR
jgi:hypothetical protein